jgi:hypothetical protein
MQHLNNLLDRYSTNEIELLKIEFQQLTTNQEKFNFWKEKFSVPYYHWASFSQSDISDFIICPQTEEEMQTFNQDILTLTESRYKLFYGKNILYDLEGKKKEFLKQLNKTENKNSLIEMQLKDIDKDVEDYQPTNINRFPCTYPKDYFINAFKDYILEGKAPNYKTLNCVIDNLISTENGYRLAQLKVFVESYQSNKQNVVPKPSNSVSIKQRLIILRELGILKQLDIDNKKIAGLLSILFSSGVENIRKDLSNIHQSQTVHDLEVVQRCFLKIGLTEQAEKLNKEIQSRKIKQTK